MHTERTPSSSPETPLPHLEELLDDALADSFPASDPVSSLMADDMPPSHPWPPLPYEKWRETCATLQLWTQVIGKIRLAQTPWLNHGWHVPLYVTARGLTTSLIPHDSLSFEIDFDFIDHALDIRVSNGTGRRIALRPRSVADFHSDVKQALADLGVPVVINEHPCEIADAIPFSQDRLHASYDAEYAQRFWRVLLACDRVFKQFRTGFLGKSSPVHFFWGSFDLAVTRFSGRRAPPFARKVPGVAGEVMREAYSHELSSAGFWPGGNGTDYPAFYSYAYPTPAGFAEHPVRPDGAFFSDALGEFVLPYERIRGCSDPAALLLEFLESTYQAAAECGGWDRAALECPLGRAGSPMEAAALPVPASP
jgi:hypothetical protein